MSKNIETRLNKLEAAHGQVNEVESQILTYREGETLEHAADRQKIGLGKVIYALPDNGHDDADSPNGEAE